MSVKLLDNEAFFGYRVRRTVNGKLYQEYFSLKNNSKRLRGAPRKAVLAEAETRDEELRLAQEKHKIANRAARCFHPDGSVRGISYLLKTEKSGAQTPIFQVGIASELEGKTVCTSYSLNAHGGEVAWQKAVDAYAKHKMISKNTKLYKDIKAAMPAV
jgi:hypothetical protein